MSISPFIIGSRVNPQSSRRVMHKNVGSPSRATQSILDESMKNGELDFVLARMNFGWYTEVEPLQK